MREQIASLREQLVHARKASRAVRTRDATVQCQRGVFSGGEGEDLAPMTIQRAKQTGAGTSEDVAPTGGTWWAVPCEVTSDALDTRGIDPAGLPSRSGPGQWRSSGRGPGGALRRASGLGSQRSLGSFGRMPSIPGRNSPVGSEAALGHHRGIDSDEMHRRRTSGASVGSAAMLSRLREMGGSHRESKADDEEGEGHVGTRMRTDNANKMGGGAVVHVLVYVPDGQGRYPGLGSAAGSITGSGRRRTSRLGPGNNGSGSGSARRLPIGDAASLSANIAASLALPAGSTLVQPPAHLFPPGHSTGTPANLVTPQRKQHHRIGIPNLVTSDAPDSADVSSTASSAKDPRLIRPDKNIVFAGDGATQPARTTLPQMGSFGPVFRSTRLRLARAQLQDEMLQEAARRGAAITGAM